MLRSRGLRRVVGLLVVSVLVVTGTTLAHTVRQLPKGAVRLPDCVPAMGYHAFVPKDMPFGPIYGVWKDNLVFTEYMVRLEEMQAGKLTNLISRTGRIDHVDVEWVPSGHPGFEVPHFDVHLWNVSHKEHMAFACP